MSGKLLGDLLANESLLWYEILCSDNATTGCVGFVGNSLQEKLVGSKFVSVRFSHAAVRKQQCKLCVVTLDHVDDVSQRVTKVTIVVEHIKKLLFCVESLCFGVQQVVTHRVVQFFAFFIGDAVRIVLKLCAEFVQLVDHVQGCQIRIQG